MATTPPFMPGQIPGVTPASASAGGVPGIPPQTPDPNDQAKKILAAILQASQRKQMQNTATPGQIPQMSDPNAARQVGMNTGNPHAWGTQQFLGGLGANIKNAVAKQKQDQLLKAEGDWTYLQSAMNEKFAAEQSGDKQSMQQAEMKIQAVLGDQKKLKNMAKALNQDWLNPEKTTVYGEALKKVTAQSQQKDQQNQQKQTAAQKLKETFMKVLGQKQQLQMTLDEQKRMAKEIEAKAPTTTAGIDKESAAALREQEKEAAKAESDERKAALKQQEDERKEAARAKELEQKEQNTRTELEMKEKFQKQRDETNNRFHETMEQMRERSAEQRQNAHDMTMMKALGMKLDAQQEKLFKPDPTKLNKEVTDSVGTLKQQLAQAKQSVKSLETQAHGKWFGTTFSPELQSDLDDAKSNADNLEKAIAHLEKNRDAIIKGKADLGDVVNKAYDIMGGSGAAEVPGFVPDKK